MEEKLKNIKPLETYLEELKKIEGFPIGEDKDILAISDVPYYTACPNPYINEFIENYGTIYEEEKDKYQKKPFVEDVTEGKSDSIYNALSYHTKVPHKAIMKFIEHYTQKGDIVFDGFGGSGMTGLAATLLGRNAITSDISTYATFIQKNYIYPIDLMKNVELLENKILEIENEIGWLYETEHFGEKTLENKKGKINYTIWSDVLSCPYCNYEYIFFDSAVDIETEGVLESYKCKNCNAEINKKNSGKILEKKYDSSLGVVVEVEKLIPVLINYTYNGKRYNKQIDLKDKEMIEKIDKIEIPFWYASDRMPNGKEARRNDKSGIGNVHQFFTKRNLYAISAIRNKFGIDNSILPLILMTNCSKMSRYGKRTGNVSGTLYIPSLIKELNVIEYLKRKLSGTKGIVKPLTSIIEAKNRGKAIISTNSATDLRNIKSNSIDYIFTDPPFGENLMYSELNFIYESWMKVKTNIKEEAIMNKSQEKSLKEYHNLMTNSLKEYYRILKPNRWITLEFHNSKASVWNAIQESITKSGFIIAQVAVIDKVQGSFKQVTSAGAVSKDLVINAYKPKKAFEERFLKTAGEGMEVEFAKQQFNHLPVEPNIERTEQMLYSKMLAHYIENGFKIKYNSQSFFELLENNFVEMDGYWFDESETLSYNEWKSKQGNLDKIKDLKQGGFLMFINNEKTALQWIYQMLDAPKSYSELLTGYNKIVDSKSKDEIPELRVILDNNFFTENGKYRRPLNKDERKELKRNREKELEKAWNKIVERASVEKKKMTTIRKEALEYGFKNCYDKDDFTTIIEVGSKLHDSILEENSEIMNFIDIAEIKLGL